MLAATHRPGRAAKARRPLTALALAALAAGTAGCSTESLGANAEHIGESLGSIQLQVTGEGATRVVNGIEEQLSHVRGDLPEAARAQVDEIQHELHDHVEEAASDPAKLTEAAAEAAAAFGQLPGNGKVAEVRDGVTKGFKNINEAVGG